MDLGATRGANVSACHCSHDGTSIICCGVVGIYHSLDDFIISFFCSGGSTQTLPMYIFSVIRSGTTPVVNALSTVLLMASTILVILFSSLNI